MYSIKNVDDLEHLEELVSLESQVKAIRLQDKLDKQNFHEDMKKVYEPVTKSLENTSQDITKTKTENSIKNNQAREDLNNKLSEIMNDRRILSTSLMSLLSKILSPENFSSFKLVKDSNSNKVNDLKINKTIPITLYNNLLTFRDTGKEFELKRDLLKISNENFNVDLASLQDQKLMYDFAEETNFDMKAQGNKSTRDRTLIKLLISPAIMASGISIVFLLSDPDELCNRIKLFLLEKHASNNSAIFNREVVAIVDKLLEYKCISKKQHNQTLIKCNLLNQ